MYAIKTENVVKQYRNGVQALSGLSLSVNAGEIFSLLGENGAGKSTLIRILTTYLRPTSGGVSMLGKNIYTDAAWIRSQIACVAQQTSIDTHLSLEENMLFQSRLYKIPKAEATKWMEKLISDFGLGRYRKYPVSSYSGGVRRRLDIALNMMSKPKILFLDEPTVGMDARSRNSMWEMMKQICNDFETTIFLTTHYLEEADSLSNSVCIMKDGKAVKQGTPAELRSLLRENIIRLQFVTEDEAREHMGVLKNLLPQEEMPIRNSAVIIHSHDAQPDMERVILFLTEHHIRFQGIESTQPTLEDVFLRLTSAGHSTGEREECI